MTKAYDALFPLGISSKQCLTSKAFRETIYQGYISGVWRHFLIIFPETESETLQSSEWMAILKEQRDKYDKLLMDFPVAAERMRTSKNWEIIVSCLGKDIGKRDLSLHITKLREITSLICHLVAETSSTKFIETVVFLVVSFYEQFLLEKVSAEENSPAAFLFNAKYILNDVYLCVKRLLTIMAPLFTLTGTTADRFHNELVAAIRMADNYTDKLPERKSITDIAGIYRTLFMDFLPDLIERRKFWTMLFTDTSDLSLFHTFYSIIYHTTKLDVPPPDYTVMVGFVALQCIRMDSEVDGDCGMTYKLKQCVSAMNNLIEMMQNENDDAIDKNRRRVLMHQIKDIISIMKSDKRHTDELIPCNLLLDAVSEC